MLFVTSESTEWPSLIRLGQILRGGLKCWPPQPTSCQWNPRPWANEKKSNTNSRISRQKNKKNAERDNMHSETEDPRVSANHITRSCQPITLRNDLRITHSFWSLKTLFFWK